jgi:hypothetical protein
MIQPKPAPTNPRDSTYASIVSLISVSPLPARTLTYSPGLAPAIATAFLRQIGAVLARWETH